MELIVKQIDYIEENGQCVRGSDKLKNVMTYELIFISNKDDSIKKCPNCGNELKDISSQICEYCHSRIVLTPTKWVLSKKKVRKQERENYEHR